MSTRQTVFGLLKKNPGYSLSDCQSCFIALVYQSYRNKRFVSAEAKNNFIHESSEEKQMEKITEKECEACRIGAPLATEDEIRTWLLQVPEWEIIEEHNIRKLIRKFTFADFKEAISFTNRVGEIAEEEGHHPAILTEYGQVTVIWWSHKIKGLHVNDFIMAARTDKILDTELAGSA
jgi:4a-hydroxytetrahydrobiopterin dehydratase